MTKEEKIQMIGAIVSDFIKQGKNEFTKEEIEERIKMIEEEKNLYKKRQEDIQLKIKRIIDIYRFSITDMISIKEEFDNIINDEKLEISEKNIKLQQIEEKIDKYYKENIEKIDEEFQQINTKIQKINDMINMQPNILKIYNAKYYLNKLNKQLKQLTSNTYQIHTEIMLKKISEQLEEIYTKTQTIFNLYKHSIPSDYYSFDIKKFKLFGIILTINVRAKTYTIRYDETNLNVIETYKLNKLKRLLKGKLSDAKFDTIITPKHVNESTLSRFIKQKEFPIKELMKFNNNGLLKNLSIDEQMKEITMEELLKESPEFKLFYEIIQFLNNEGYESVDVPQIEELLIDLNQKYKGIYLTEKQTYETIGKCLLDTFPNETYVYSSMQNVYNCIDRNLIQKMHRDLSKNTPNLTTDIEKVIIFMQKYARNSKGEVYTVKEILNFLKQKNEIVNTKYRIEQDVFMDSLEFNTEVNEIMQKLTGVRANYHPSQEDYGTYEQQENIDIIDNSTSKKRK